MVTRAEYSNMEDEHLANSSFYALIDGNFTDCLSYSVSTHLLSSAPGDLYAYTWHSDSANWLDWANLTYDFGRFRCTLGKNFMLVGTFESQEYDFDSYFETASLFWGNQSDISPIALDNVYLWGGSVEFDLSETVYGSIQVSSSPYNVRPFDDGLFAYSVILGKEAAEDEWFNALVSFNFVQAEPDSFKKLQFAGVSAAFDSFTVTLDEGAELGADSNIALNAKASYDFSPKWTVGVNAGYESGLYGPCAQRRQCGLLLNWKPLESLRAHALVSYDSLLDNVLFNFGLTWKLAL